MSATVTPQLEPIHVARIQIAECALPLPFILRLGTIAISTRDYIALRIETASGLFGEAIGYTRGTPLFETLRAMAARMMTANASMRREIMFNLERSNVPARSGLTRGLSLIDIALWDIAAKQARLPLFQFLGGWRRRAPATVVAGYYMDRRSIDDIADEAARLADLGYQRVKIMLKGDDPAFDRSYVSTVTLRLPGKVAADAHWSWTTLTDAKRMCREIDTYGLNFLEDPFAASDWRLTHELQRQLATPIAAGEDVFGARAVSDLVSGIDILRVDATTCGGITGAMEAISLAAGAGRTVLPHVFASLHVHFACAYPNVEGVELIPEESGADPIDKLLLQTPAQSDGSVSPSEEPGIGIMLDWTAIEKLSRRTDTINPTA